MRQAIDTYRQADVTLPYYIPVRSDRGAIVRLVNTRDGAATEEWKGFAWVPSRAWPHDVLSGSRLTAAERAALSLWG